MWYNFASEPLIAIKAFVSPSRLFFNNIGFYVCTFLGYKIHIISYITTRARAHIHTVCTVDHIADVRNLSVRVNFARAIEIYTETDTPPHYLALCLVLANKPQARFNNYFRINI